MDTCSPPSTPSKRRFDFSAILSGSGGNRRATSASYISSWPTRPQGFLPPISAASTRQTHPTIEADWRAWLAVLFPVHVAAGFAPHHAALWEWVWAIERGVRPPPFVAIWPRGGAKSTTAELATVAVGARAARRYGLYISETQEQADGHVQSVAGLLESPTVEPYYPALASRAVGKYGASRGWRRNRLSTATGFTVDAIGFDTAARGIKIDEARPDFIVLDDIDNQKDSPERVAKKIATLTRGLLPVGANDVAVLAVQNLIHDDSIFSMLADGRAGFLADRIVAGPIKAVEGLEIERRDGRDIVVGGLATWAGQDLATVQRNIADWGLTAFLAEAQHETSVLRERIYLMEWWAGRNRYRIGDGAPVVGRWLFVDTAMKDRDTSDFSACTLFELMADYRVRVRPLWNERLLFPDLVARIEATAHQWRRERFDEELLRGVVVEDKGSGTSAIQTIQAVAPEWLAVLMTPFMPTGDKPYRGRQASVWCGRDMILLPHPDAAVPDLFAFEQQLEYFPNVPHDDYEDTFAMGVIFLNHLLEAGFEARREIAPEVAA
jgi:phage terminase large subunit-like protein